MVKICNTEYPVISPYNEYFDQYPYPLSDFQKHAIQGIVDGNHVLVTAHTGSGKTLPAEFAINYFHKKNKKIIYTSPIKALSNQKYYEFTKKYPHISFGLFTGDIKVNSNADVLIMTTEILMNSLFAHKNSIAKNMDFQINIETELICVVFDEVHYINDANRGQNWEQTILMLPSHIQMIMLSATIDQPERFAKWCERSEHTKDIVQDLETNLTNPHNKIVCLCPTTHRVVPLTHYAFLTTNESIFKILKDKVLEKQIRDNTNKLIILQTDKGVFQETGVSTIKNMQDLFSQKQVFFKRKMVLNRLAEFLKEKEMLPAIAFVFSRKNVELFAKEITVPVLEDDSKVPYIVKNECDQIIRRLPNYKEYAELPEYNSLVSLLEKGIGIHHSGMIPILREIVELMISKKYIKILFATESFAIGLDCPIKTAIFTGLAKYDGSQERLLYSHEYTQMAGRAGRRGIDTIGNVIHCNNLFITPGINEYRSLIGGKPQKLVSKFHISYSMVLRLLLDSSTVSDINPTLGNTQIHHKTINEIAFFANKSMVYQEIHDSLRSIKNEIGEIKEKIDKKQLFLNLLRTPIEKVEQYIDLVKKQKNTVNKKRREIDRLISDLETEFRFIKTDMVSLNELIQLNVDLTKKQTQSDETENYLLFQISGVLEILGKEKFIDKMPNNVSYRLTDLGEIAVNIAEIHPLIISKLIYSDWNFFEQFTEKQIVGLLSCFTDIRVNQDIRAITPVSKDLFLKSRISEIKTSYQDIESVENELSVFTGIDYRDSLIFDIIDESMEWCDCETEQECKYFIQTKISGEKSISIGDFTKALLKIVVIVKELVSMVENAKVKNNHVELLHKLGKIEPMVLKYIATNQSLYVE